MPERRSEPWLVTCGAISRPAHVRSGSADGLLEIEIGSGETARTVTAAIVSYSTDTCVVSIEGRSTVVRLARQGGEYQAMAAGESFTATSAAEMATGTGSGASDGSAADAGSRGVDLDALCAPMPATVSAILVEPGAAVEAGDTLVRLEAMKMELAIRAPSPGCIATVDCRVGDLVQPGRPLVALEGRPTTAGKPHR